MVSIDPPGGQSDAIQRTPDSQPAVQPQISVRHYIHWALLLIVVFSITIGLRYILNRRTAVPASVSVSPTHVVLIESSKSGVVNNPFNKARNEKRRADETAIIDALRQYEAANVGNTVTGITQLPRKISKSEVDLCAAIVPEYLPALPHDEALNITSGKKDSPITDCTRDYDSGFTIEKTGSNQYTVAAPLTEEGTPISVTK